MNGITNAVSAWMGRNGPSPIELPWVHSKDEKSLPCKPQTIPPSKAVYSVSNHVANIVGFNLQAGMGGGCCEMSLEITVRTTMCEPG